MDGLDERAYIRFRQVREMDPEDRPRLRAIAMPGRIAQHGTGLLRQVQISLDVKVHETNPIIRSPAGRSGPSSMSLYCSQELHWCRMCLHQCSSRRYKLYWNSVLWMTKIPVFLLIDTLR